MQTGDASMLFLILVDIVVAIHFAFALFAALGGFFVIWWRKIVWLHVPAVLYAALIEFSGRICPLTPLENWLRMKGVAAGYSGGMIDPLILPILYPDGLTYNLQILLGVLVLVFNALIYWQFVLKRRKHLNNKSE